MDVPLHVSLKNHRLLLKIYTLGNDKTCFHWMASIFVCLRIFIWTVYSNINIVVMTKYILTVELKGGNTYDGWGLKNKTELKDLKVVFHDPIAAWGHHQELICKAEICFCLWEGLVELLLWKLRAIFTTLEFG
jgi:hypothetical protein